MVGWRRYCGVMIAAAISQGLLFSGPAWAQSRPTVAAQPAGDELVSRVSAAIDSDTLLAFAADVSRQCVPLLAQLKDGDLPELARLCSFGEFARFFAKLDHPGDAQKLTMKWLVAQPHLMPTLLSAVGDLDRPELVLAIISDLKTSSSAQVVEDNAELATAFAVVWDKPPYLQLQGGKPEFSKMNRRFAYFTSLSQPIYSFRALPWQLAVYVADIRIGDADIAWAATTYGRRVRSDQLGGIYFDVPYDYNYFYRGTAKAIGSCPYTLPNILKYGGVCSDQAYFATQIAKANGLPACICQGAGGADGIRHAWVGFLQEMNGAVSWNFQQGRYSEDLFWTADIYDPQTRQQLSDADVGLLANLQHTTPSQRLESTALVKLAQLVPSTRRMSLYTRAVNLSSGNRAAWLALAKLGEDKYLTEAQVAAVSDAASRFLARSNPDFACNLFLKLADQGDAAGQVHALDRVVGLFRSRPDLVAKIRLRQGDLLRKINNLDLAFVAYNDVLQNELNGGPAVITAAKRIDDMLRKAGTLRALANLYKQLFQRMTVPERSLGVPWTPYYQIGKEYAAVLDDLGDHSSAAAVLARIDALVPAAAQNGSSFR